MKKSKSTSPDKGDDDDDAIVQKALKYIEACERRIQRAMMKEEHFTEGDVSGSPTKTFRDLQTRKQRIVTFTVRR